MKSIYRTHNCGELTLQDADHIVTLSGWVHSKRDHGGVIFVDLRDHYGITQIVIDEGICGIKSEELNLPLESIITVTGNVVLRQESTIRDDISTGKVEVMISSVIIQSISEVVPIPINNNNVQCNEEIRLKYRFLDLRRQEMHNRILMRSNIIHWIRNRMVDIGFTEFQTPILTSSSPEGARDFLVPSRLHPGKFYALPQAPQQFKQLLMISGFDKYFQIAPCFRDEDVRADRSPGEFYQLDLEMSFVEMEDVLCVVEKVLYDLFVNFSTKEINNLPFPRIRYADAMLKYGSDKPDLRNPIINSDVTSVFQDSGFSIFANAIKSGSVVRAIPAPGCGSMPRSFFDGMIEYAKQHGANGLAYISFDAVDGSAKGPIAKLLTERELDRLCTISLVKPGDAVFLSCGSQDAANRIAGLVRTSIGMKQNLISKDQFKFCWIVDFPYFEWNEEQKKIDFSHNPFSMPKGGLDVLKTNDKNELLKIKANQYDIVCNGVELSSGAIRNHLPEIMYRAFEIAGYDKSTVDAKFGGMINALKFGAPPHGGCAPGIDRIVMLLAETDNIRDIIAFPMNGRAEDLLMCAPNNVTEKQLKELHIKVDTKE